MLPGSTVTPTLLGLEAAHRRIGIALCFAAVAVILLLHYRAGLENAGPHDILRRMFYVPVIAAAILGGFRAGLVTAALAAVVYLPHLNQLAQAGFRILDHGLELVLLPLLGGLVGAFADSRRQAQTLAVDRGRLAALGEIGLGLMAQIEGPLGAIEGQSESLEVVSELHQNDAVGMAARTIRSEAVRVRRLLIDLRALSRAAERRPTSVDLPSFIRSLVGDLRERPLNGVQVLSAEGAGGPVIVTNGPALAYALRSFLFGLIEALPGSGRIEIGCEEPETTAVVRIGVHADEADVPNLEHALGSIFSADPQAYHFDEAICVRLLASEGATIEFRRVSPQAVIVRLHFQMKRPPRGREVRGSSNRGRRRRNNSHARPGSSIKQPLRNPEKPGLQQPQHTFRWLSLETNQTHSKIGAISIGSSLGGRRQ